jgi:single-strand DNA-binding protein
MYQHITLVGNLGRDPELRYTPAGQPVTDLSVATKEVWKDQAGEKQDRTTWWKVSVWGKQAENCNQFLTKGSRVLVEGTLRGDESGNPRTYQKKDGTTGSSFEMTAKEVRFLSAKNGSDDGGGAAAPAATKVGVAMDDLPF